MNRWTKPYGTVQISASPAGRRAAISAVSVKTALSLISETLVAKKYIQLSPHKLSPSLQTSMDFIPSQPLVVDNKKIKRRKDKSAEKNNKKRKRKTDEDSGDAAPAPAKKRRPLDRTDPSSVKDVPAVQLDAIDESPFYEKTYSLYLPISPISYHYPLSGLCAEHLSPLILKYYPPFHGVVLSYGNAKFTAQPQGIPENEKPSPILARSVDEYAASFVWITADFLIFSPKRGNSIEGLINIQNQGNLGLLCWGFFNVHIERKRLPKDWTWVSCTSQSHSANNHEINRSIYDAENQREEEQRRTNSVGVEEGYFQDGNGTRVEGLVHFWVKDVESSRGLDRENNFVSIKGTMLSAEEEHALEKHEAARRDGKVGRVLRGWDEEERVMSGSLNENSVGDLMDIDRIAQSRHDSIAI